MSERANPKKLFQVICYVMAETVAEAAEIAATRATSGEMIPEEATRRSVMYDGFSDLMPVNGATEDDERTCMQIIEAQEAAAKQAPTTDEAAPIEWRPAEKVAAIQHQLPIGAACYADNLKGDGSL